MRKNIQIEKYRIDEKQKVLELELAGRVGMLVPGRRLRLSAIFQAKACNRHYPILAYCEPTQDGDVTFRASARIELEYVFYQYRREGEKTVSLRFACCDLKEKWIAFEETLLLPAQLFEQREHRVSLFTRWKNRLLYVGCTLLLPVWLLDGYLAVKGKKTLHPAAKGMQGKKAILYHAHGLVNGWTGYGYSIREMKTNYFARQYQKACRRLSKTQGVLFLSERRVEPGGNLDLVKKEMEKQGICKVSQFLETRPVHKLTWKELRRSAGLIAAARVVVLEDFYPQLHALSIRQETQILQMWHACGAFKLFGLSELGLVEHLQQSTRNHRSYTQALVSGNAVAPFYSEAFGVCDNCIKPIGIPRTDIFFQEEYRSRIREKLLDRYPVCQGKKVILFAPTFRGSGNKTAYFPRAKFPVNQVMEALPEDVVLILKNHPFVREKWDVEEKFRSRVLDLSEAENINDLLFITSLLVTDYSSVIFEAALVHIPMVFYAFDLQEYLDKRNLYFDFASFAPGEIVTTTEELIRQMQYCLSQPVSAQKNYQEFCAFFLDALDGQSTRRTVQLIEQMLLTTT